jgi:Ca2+-binding EF-hand superfamily protein
MESLLDVLSDEAKLDLLTTEVFSQVDTDHSGQVSKRELSTAVRKLARDYGLALPTDREIARIMETVDADDSGTLNKEEFKVLLVVGIRTLVKAS